MPLPTAAHRREAQKAPCGARLDQAPLPAARPTAQLLDLQHHILDLLSAQGGNAEAREYFSDLHLLTALITASWPHSRYRVDTAYAPAVDAEARARKHFGTLRVHDTPPTDPIACGAVLAAAHSMLQTKSLRDVLAELFDSAFTSTPARMG
ncbi:hypothetical protein ACVB8X_15160 [Streptomyces sp. NRAIS4]